MRFWALAVLVVMACGPTGSKSMLILDVVMTGFESHQGKTVLMRFVDDAGEPLGSVVLATVPSSGGLETRQMFSSRAPLRLQFFVDQDVSSTWSEGEPAWEHRITFSDSELLFGQKRLEARSSDTQTVMPPDWR